MLTRRLVGGIRSKVRVISADYVKLASPTGAALLGLMEKPPTIRWILSLAT